jgi:hypothetical protein
VVNRFEVDLAVAKLGGNKLGFSLLVTVVLLGLNKLLVDVDSYVGPNPVFKLSFGG